MVKLYFIVGSSTASLLWGILQLMAVKLTGGGVFQTREAILRHPFGVCNSCCSFPRLKSFLLCSSSWIQVCTLFIHCRHSGSLHLVIWHYWGMLRWYTGHTIENWQVIQIWHSPALYAKIEIKPAILVIVRSRNCFAHISKSYTIV